MDLRTVAALLKNHSNTLKEYTVHEIYDDAVAPFIRTCEELNISNLDLRSIGRIDCLLWYNIPYTSLDTLKSCPRSEHFLQSLVNTLALENKKDGKALALKTILPSLREFVFQHEQPTAQLKHMLHRFLALTTGFEIISVLLENTDDMSHPAGFLE